MDEPKARGPRTILFSPPYDFNPSLRTEYEAYAPTVFQEVREPGDLPEIPHLDVWVCQAGQTFLIDQDILRRYPDLEVLVTASTGNDHVDLNAVAQAGVDFYSLLDDREGLDRIAASAEMTFHLLLNCLRKLEHCVAEVAAGRWRENEPAMRGRELQGRKVGIVGLGRIGSRMARYCSAFGCSIGYFDPYVDDPAFHRYADIETLFSESDCISINCSLTGETRGFIGWNLLRRMGAGAVLVNTSRGEVVDDEALARILEVRPDLRAGIDVLPGEVEGRPLSSPLMAAFRRGQVTITPHIAGASVESQTKAALISLGLVKRHYGKGSSTDRSVEAGGGGAMAVDRTPDEGR